MVELVRVRKEKKKKKKKKKENPPSKKPKKNKQNRTPNPLEGSMSVAGREEANK